MDRHANHGIVHGRFGCGRMGNSLRRWNRKGGVVTRWVMPRWVMQSAGPLMADLTDTVRPTTRAAIRSVAEFDACFTREYVGLVRLVWLIVGSQPAAEDAVQDAFVVLHRRWADVQRPGAFVRTAALNNARRVARRATVERRLIRRAALRDSLGEGEIRRTSSTSETTSTGETSSTVSSAIGSTSAHRRSPRMSPAHVNPFVQWSVVADVCDAWDSPACSRLLSWFRSP